MGFAGMAMGQSAFRVKPYTECIFGSTILENSGIFGNIAWSDREFAKPWGQCHAEPAFRVNPEIRRIFESMHPEKNGMFGNAAWSDRDFAKPCLTTEVPS